MGWRIWILASERTLPGHLLLKMVWLAKCCLALTTYISSSKKRIMSRGDVAWRPRALMSPKGTVGWTTVRGVVGQALKLIRATDLRTPWLPLPSAKAPWSARLPGQKESFVRFVPPPPSCHLLCSVQPLQASPCFLTFFQPTLVLRKVLIFAWCFEYGFG